MPEYPQGRSMVLARRGVVATDHPLASAAGIRVLEQSGNAIDAAVCVAATLGVVTPMMTGIGGDTFIVYYQADSGQVLALNGSGAAPQGATPEFFRRRGFETMPLRGMLSPSVPGAVDAMAAALERWGSGRWSLSQLLEPAIYYAEAGHPVTEKVAVWFEEIAPVLRRYPSSARILLPQGRPPRVGEILVQADMARSLRMIADQGARAFYEGPLADAIVAYAQANGGLLTAADLAAHRSEQCVPVTATFRDLTVHTCPPPSQGFRAAGDAEYPRRGRPGCIDLGFGGRGAPHGRGQETRVRGPAGLRRRPPVRRRPARPAAGQRLRARAPPGHRCAPCPGCGRARRPARTGGGDHRLRGGRWGGKRGQLYHQPLGGLR